MKFDEKVLVDGRVRLRWREPKPGGGYYKPQATVESRDAAILFKAEIVQARTAGLISPQIAKQRTVRDIASRWIESKAVELVATTVRSYAGTFDLHVDPFLGGRSITDLAHPTIIEAWLEELAHGERGTDGTWRRRPVGDATRNRALMVVSGIVTFAQRHGYVQTHGVQRMDKRRKPSCRRKSEIEPLSVGQVEALRQWMLAKAPAAFPADRARYAAMISMLSYTGMRPGELLALTRRDVRERTATVRATVADGKRENRVKTRRGRPRSPRLIGPLREDLDRWLTHVPDDAEALVFGSRAGRPWKKDDWDNWRNRVFKIAVADLGIATTTRPYDLRHTCVSLRVMQGDNVIEIADDLGHNVSMTLDTYSHVVGEYRGLPASERGTMEEMVVAARAASRHGAGRY